MFHGGGGWWAYLSYDEKEDRPGINRTLLRRVGQFARPYSWPILGLLLTIFVMTGLGLLTPLLLRDLIDNVLPNRDTGRLN
jgi:ATP-binding cassette subfamily B protein